MRSKILIVDDRQKWLDLIELILGDKYDLTFVKTPEEARNAFESEDIHLVILDKNLPSESDGIGLLRYFRDLNPDLPTIMLTEFENVSSAVETMKLGAADYVPKNSSQFESVLASRVDELLEESRDTSLYIRSLIKQGETSTVEFKSSLRWDYKANAQNKELENSVIKTIAGFLNSDKEGDLFVGVSDQGEVLGLKNDYKMLGKRPDADGFEQLLTTIVLDACGKDCIAFLRVRFYQIDGVEICRVNVRPSAKPIFVKSNRDEHFYVRTGNATRHLSTREALEYCKVRFYSS